MDIGIIVRLVVFLSVVILVLKVLITKVREFRHRSRLVDSVPGPKIFTLLLGNIPTEIIQYIGADFHLVKDLYYGEWLCWGREVREQFAKAT